jgi:hypothetical protein
MASKYYMHLIDGRPAEFDDGMICYTHTGSHVRHGVKLCRDLKQVKREQAASHKFRNARGWDLMDYDYVPVNVES